jgi:ring-1,2-phenylacetyl-CoA epoxidase subunit PaaC
MTNHEQLTDKSYKEALTALLYQLADDDFILAYRGSEWLGLAPHIEEDLAFSSINQDTMGHAAMYYQLLGEIGEGNADALAHGRGEKDRRNAIVLELVNGPGSYLKDPNYDWAFAVVRHYFYSVAKKVRMDSLKNSSYQPLADVAVKVNMELYYHLFHWKTWFIQLTSSNSEAKKRMKAAIEKVCRDFEGVLTLGPMGSEMVDRGLIEAEDISRKRWISELNSVMEPLDIKLPPLEMTSGNGRIGEHTKDLTEAISTLSEVYRTNPAAAW